MPSRPTADNVRHKTLHRNLLLAARRMDELMEQARLAEGKHPADAAVLDNVALRCADAQQALLDASRVLLVGGDVTVSPRQRSI